MASRVILLRHTGLAGGIGRCYGRTELPLASSAAQDFSEVVATLPPVDLIVSSPTLRCRQLAEAIASARDAPLAFDPRWQELDFGRWEGLPWDEVPRDQLDAWAADTWAYAPGGGESAQALYARVGEAIAQLRSSTVADSVLVVSHAGPLRAARVLLERLQFAAHFDLPAACGQWRQISLR